MTRFIAAFIYRWRFPLSAFLVVGAIVVSFDEDRIDAVRAG